MAVKGVAAMNSMPLLMNTSNPKVHRLADFTDRDKIALPAVKVSVQAMFLQMAAERSSAQAAATTSTGSPSPSPIPTAWRRSSGAAR
ncbi:hypothetical protein ACU4GR_08745 (plasmid) [Methylobacterium oryzae CBMB20]